MPIGAFLKNMLIPWLDKNIIISQLNQAMLIPPVNPVFIYM